MNPYKEPNSRISQSVILKLGFLASIIFNVILFLDLKKYTKLYKSSSCRQTKQIQTDHLLRTASIKTYNDLFEDEDDNDDGGGSNLNVNTPHGNNDDGDEDDYYDDQYADEDNEKNGKGIKAPSKRQTNLSLDEFITINQRLAVVTESNNKTCECGCYRSRIPSCPRLYDMQDIMLSSNVHKSKEIEHYMDLILQQRKRKSQQECQLHENNSESSNDIQNESDHTNSGGYCLQKLKFQDKHYITYPYSNRHIPIPKGHVVASPILIASLKAFIAGEQSNHTKGFSSISDFGAGIGQYGVHLETTQFPSTLIYKGYDGAGDVEDYTHGYLRFFDLTIPLNLPVTDWIISLEVGEHIPSQMEGMMIRNLHTHNCKGIILSWGVEGQGGENHVNLHNNEYIIDIFQELGYVHDQVETNKFRDAFPEHRVNGHWFQNSLMVLRRVKPVC